MKNIYVWLKISTGEFSNSWNDDDWTEKEHKEYIRGDDSNDYKLIKYECENDDTFEFNQHMVLK